MSTPAMTFAEQLRGIAQWFEAHPDVTPPVECVKRLFFIIGHEYGKSVLPEQPLNMEWRCQAEFVVERRRSALASFALNLPQEQAQKKVEGAA